MTKMFSITPSVAADTGVHLGDGHLSIRPNGTHSYDITGNALEDQLYLLGHVIPTIESAYGLRKFGIYRDAKENWMSIVYQSKDVALFKHQIVGLPNGRKTNLSIPRAILNDSHLMRYCVREILATDGLLGFYNASSNRPHKYPRIQIKMTAHAVLEEVTAFVREEFGIRASCRLSREAHGSQRLPRYIIQINRQTDIDTWRDAIGFSNPSHISRMMVFEELGECPPGTTILDRLSFLTGCTSALSSTSPLPRSAFESATSRMRREFGSPELNAHQMIERIEAINMRLRHLGRKLPQIVDPETIE